MIPASKRSIAGGLAVALLLASQATGQTRPHGASVVGTPVKELAATPVAELPGLAAAAPEYKIGPEDVLDIVVWGNVDLTRTAMQVRPDGRISLPIANDVLAAGLTPMQLRAAIIRGLEPQFHDQEVSVTVREVNSLKISIVGLVRNPSRVLLRSQMTVLDAIATAGGFVDFAKRDKVYVLRNGNRMPFNYDKFISEPVSEDNFLLQAGDTVVIP